MKNKYCAFIPLRGGSKSIPLKNIKLIAGKPLAWWTIEAALGCASIDHVYIATDSEDIKKSICSLQCNRLSIVGRSAETATDTASTESAMIEFARNYTYLNIILIQATSPLLSSSDLQRGVNRFESYNADSLVSVVPQKRFLWSIAEDGYAHPKNYNPLQRPRRQEFDEYYVENGAFYISRRDGLLQHNSRLFGKITALSMSEETYFEIDEPHDWVIVESQLNNKILG